MPVTALEFPDQIASNSSNVTINQFQKYFADGSLILRPPFQRNLVWNKEQQSFLIDSVLRGLPVPELYVQSMTSADGDEQYIVVDGQQRISACLRFLSGELRLVGGDDLDPRWRSRTFREIDEPLRKRFRSYQLIVRQLPDLGEGVLREVFRRLNKTVEPLQPQELRHAAYTGPFIEFVELAAAHPVLGEVGVFSATDYLRRRSDELIAEIAFALVSRAFPNKKEGLDELFLTYERQGVPDGVVAELERRFGRVFQQLTPIAGGLRRTRFRNKSDFYSLFVALANRAESLPLDDAASDSLISGLAAFSSLVNEIKRAEDDPEAVKRLASTDHGVDATNYLRAVERAASDRLSRVRRNEGLESVLGPLLGSGAVTDLAQADSAWLDETLGPSGEEDPAEQSSERAHVADLLLRTDVDQLGEYREQP